MMCGLRSLNTANRQYRTRYHGVQARCRITQRRLARVRKRACWATRKQYPDSREPRPRSRPGLPGRLHRADVLRLRALLALGHVELDLLALIERAVAGRRDRGVVHEDVGTPTFDGDEAVALFGVEPLHGALCHVPLLKHLIGPPR